MTAVTVLSALGVTLVQDLQRNHFFDDINLIVNEMGKQNIFMAEERPQVQAVKGTGSPDTPSLKYIPWSNNLDFWEFFSGYVVGVHQ
jgi:hypothetical protein